MDFEKLKSWFENYKKYSIHLTKSKIESDLEKFKNLLSDFANYQNKIDEEDRIAAPDYNVFYLLNYIKD